MRPLLAKFVSNRHSRPKRRAASPIGSARQFKARSVRKTFSFIAGLVLIILSAGCNTVSGFGKDVQKLGKKMETAADRHIR